ncbi:hypothetical protein AMAG_13447 [Allomyces macrogynus ATCC 38327]|uniref:F-box domain-containing protein n=1 Tax=Allomyces macrogynus (strain ATCC 38327) TaxID=578462 RepID=A0A0L0T261_ALLM3|nr:hypothetical protein AMAG_13447 [Allomyces macrogynus ATCC 38327]|eukprot:KNE68807.1 hypothetical protein AMAG_13447 [Allomyces macrogynus ATCC 38327]
MLDLPSSLHPSSRIPTAASASGARPPHHAAARPAGAPRSITLLASGSGSGSPVSRPDPARGSAAGRHASVRAVSHPALFRHDSGVADVVGSKWAVDRRSASPLGAVGQPRPQRNGTAAALPHDVCLAILRHLSIMDRLISSRVCRAWRTAAVCPSLWATISFTYAVAHRVPLGAVLRLMAWGSASLVHLDLRGCSNVTSIEPILAAAAMFAPNLRHLDLRGLAPLPRRPIVPRAGPNDRDASDELDADETLSLPGTFGNSLVQLANLRTLYLSSASPHLTDVDLAVGLRASCATLTVLDLARLPGVTGTALALLCDTPNAMPSLHTLRVQGLGGLDARVTAAIGAACPALRVLDVADCTDVILAPLIAGRKATALTTLRTARTNVSDAALTAVASASPNLTTLDISECPHLTPVSLSSIARTCPSLRVLDAESCRAAVTDVALVDLAVGARALRDLRISGCPQVTDVGAMAVVRRHAASLRTLHVDGCPHISDALLAGILHFPPRQLRELNVADCPQVSYLMVQHVVEVAPGLRVKSAWATRDGEVVPTGPVVAEGEGGRRRQVTIEDVVLGSAPLCPIV